MNSRLFSVHTACELWDFVYSWFCLSTFNICFRQLNAVFLNVFTTF